MTTEPPEDDPLDERDDLADLVDEHQMRAIMEELQMVQDSQENHDVG